MAKTPVSTAGCTSLIPGRGTKIPRAMWPKLVNLKKKKMPGESLLPYGL